MLTTSLRVTQDDTEDETETGRHRSGGWEGLGEESLEGRTEGLVCKHERKHFKCLGPSITYAVVHVGKIKNVFFPRGTFCSWNSAVFKFELCKRFQAWSRCMYASHLLSVLVRLARHLCQRNPAQKRKQKQ